jgi:4-diphosphocytidyl-2-C-methyl-D-erythritol kinase
VNLSTKKVFETNNLFSANFRVEETLNNNLNKLFKITHNDLEDSAIKLCPDIGKIKDEISKQKGLIASRMTGSGSSYFAIFEDRNATLLAEQQIKNYNSNWWTSIVTTI